MSGIVAKAIKAGEAPNRLRGDLETEATVLAPVHRLTENGFTQAFEAEVLKAKPDVEGVPFRPSNVEAFNLDAGSVGSQHRAMERPANGLLP